MSIKKNPMLMAVVKKQTTIENALDMEMMIHQGTNPDEIEENVRKMIPEEWQTHPKIKAMGWELEDELHDIIVSQRQLRARGYGKAPLWKLPEVKGRCTRCGGTGIVEQYRHHNGGRCFKCGGTGI